MMKISPYMAEDAINVKYGKEERYFIISLNPDQKVCWGEDVYLASEPNDALGAYIEDQIIGDLLEEASDEAYEAIPEEMLDADQAELTKIPGFDWDFKESEWSITYKGVAQVTFYAIEVEPADYYCCENCEWQGDECQAEYCSDCYEEQEEQEERDENEHWYFDETCNWKVGANDGWN